MDKIFAMLLMPVGIVISVAAVIDFIKVPQGKRRVSRDFNNG